MRVRSKQKVRDKVGPLVDNAGNIITQGFLMAEELNMHFSSVFTREDTSSIPVPETKFKGSEGERLGQLVVTPEVVVSKINNMKENKSPGVDGISPKILKETVEQISTPLAHVFNMSLKEGIVPFEWKEANIIPLFKKGSRNKSVNYRPVSLTSVMCKLLETIIRDHMMDFLIKHKLTRRFTEAGSKVVFTLDPVLFRILANRTRRVDLASGLQSHYKRLTRRERYVSTSPCTHCVCFATGCDPITCT